MLLTVWPSPTKHLLTLDGKTMAEPKPGRVSFLEKIGIKTKNASIRIDRSMVQEAHNSPDLRQQIAIDLLLMLRNDKAREQEITDRLQALSSMFFAVCELCAGYSKSCTVKHQKQDGEEQFERIELKSRQDLPTETLNDAEWVEFQLEIGDEKVDKRVLAFLYLMEKVGNADSVNHHLLDIN
jgi:hypothetical protein